MKELTCRFGEDERLVGIVTADEEAPPRAAAFVLVTAGVAPKSGPFRLYAALGRRLAAAGFTSLRFDLGGIGDSRAAGGGEALEARTRREIGAALDYLASAHGIESAVLCGLCSGAEDSFRAAESDPRVAGVVMIDPFAYKTRGWALHQLAHKATRRVLRAVGLYRPLAHTPRPSLVDYKYMEPPESRRVLGAVLDRRAHVHFVYTGGSPLYNHAGQLQAMFPGLDFRGLVTLDHLPQVDHTQLLEADRRAIVDAIARRLSWVEGARLVGRESGVLPLAGDASVAKSA